MSQRFYKTNTNSGRLSNNVIVWDTEIGLFLSPYLEATSDGAEELVVLTIYNGIIQLVCDRKKSFYYNPIQNQFYSQPINFVSDVGLFGVSDINKILYPEFKFELEFGYMAYPE